MSTRSTRGKESKHVACAEPSWSRNQTRVQQRIAAKTRLEEGREGARQCVMAPVLLTAGSVALAQAFCVGVWALENTHEVHITSGDEVRLQDGEKRAFETKSLLCRGESM